MKKTSIKNHIGKFELLYCVALTEDLPEFDLKAGDVGTIVEVYTPTDFEVDFTAPGGYMSALLTINIEWLRTATEEDFKHQRDLPPNEFMGTVKPRSEARAERE